MYATRLAEILRTRVRSGGISFLTLRHWPRAHGARPKKTRPGIAGIADTEQANSVSLCSSTSPPKSLRYIGTQGVTEPYRQELDRRLARDPALSNISVIGLDPGCMPSDLLRRGGFMLRVVFMKIVFPILNPILVQRDPNGAMRTSAKSAGDVVRAVFDIEAPTGGKGLYLNGTDEMEVAKDARDETKRRSLWEYGLKAGGIREGDTVLKEWQ